MIHAWDRKFAYRSVDTRLAMRLENQRHLTTFKWESNTAIFSEGNKKQIK